MPTLLMAPPEFFAEISFLRFHRIHFTPLLLLRTASAITFPLYRHRLIRPRRHYSPL